MEDVNITLVVALVTLHQFIATVFTLFMDVPTAHDSRLFKKRNREDAPYKRNQSMRYDSPTSNLEAVPVLEQILVDDNRGYMKKLTHLHAWQFFMLGDRLKELIERPRNNGQKVGPNPKHDYRHRLFFCLKWLNDGNFHRTREVETGWSKTSLQRDTVHVLKAIVEGLDDELQWPDGNRRQELAHVFPEKIQWLYWGWRYKGI